MQHLLRSTALGADLLQPGRSLAQKLEVSGDHARLGTEGSRM